MLVLLFCFPAQKAQAAKNTGPSAAGTEGNQCRFPPSVTPPPPHFSNLSVVPFIHPSEGRAAQEGAGAEVGRPQRAQGAEPAYLRCLQQNPNLPHPLRPPC